MKSVFVTTSAYGRAAVHANGQGYYAPIIEQAGGTGIEIRRELFVEEHLPLVALRDTLRQTNLQVVYSAPVNIWLPSGLLNWEGIKQIVGEARELGARLVKFSLGCYEPPVSDLAALRRLLQELDLSRDSLQFTVENDQTKEGGPWQNLQSFLTGCRERELSVGMTFDIGNWNWSDQTAEAAARTLAEHVVYIHCKHVKRDGDRLLTVPLPTETDAAWRTLLQEFLPQNVPCAIEFPLVGSDLQQVTKQYVDLLRTV